MALSPEVISIGNMLVEIMRTGLDQPLDRAGTFAGPFPSGDTPIYIDTVARLGRSAGFIGAVGPDDFGRCLLERLERDGVDISQVATLPGQTTGVAFVAYFTGGSRKFIYHWRHAAAGRLAPEHVHPEYLQEARWLHVTGCNLAVTESARQACYRAVELLPRQARLSFDANLRPELLSAEEIRELCRPVIERADVILPSLSEAAMLTGAGSDKAGCRLWADQGKIVVLKMGPLGCRIYRGAEIIEAPGFAVTEVDPTGAGDSFCAGFTVALLEGMDLVRAGRFANAVGALAVTKLGPMEGSPGRAQVAELMHQQQ
jgi:sugar/nucleoside kinase (ribokinase family)